jgi:hypothetical protein
VIDKNREKGCRKENMRIMIGGKKERAQTGRKRDKEKAVEKKARID